MDDLEKKILIKAPESVMERNNKFVMGVLTEDDAVKAFAETTKTMGMTASLIEDEGRIDEILIRYGRALKNKKVYIIFEESDFGVTIRRVLESNESFEGYMLVEKGTKLTLELPNIRLIRKPLSRESLSLIFNDLCIDFDTAIKMLGSEALFERILRQYYNALEQKLNTIDGLYVSKDWKNYIVEVHSLKSSSRQVGLIDISKMAAHIEQAGYNNDFEYIDACHNALINKGKEIIALLDGAFIV